MRFSFLLPLLLLVTLAGFGQLPQLSSTDQASPIILQKLGIEINCIGNRTITTFTMAFHNSSNKIREGLFLFPLPEGAFVTRYALDIDGKMREGVPVEKEKATQVFEEVEKRRIDPGLLEKTEGNNFRTRIYPIPAEGERTIIIAFEQSLLLNKENELVYQLPLEAKTKIEHIAIAVNVLYNEAMPVIDHSPVEELVFTKKQEEYHAVAQAENAFLKESLSFRIKIVNLQPVVFQQRQNGLHYFFVNTFLEPSVQEKKMPKKLAIVWDNSLSGLFRDTASEIQVLQAYLSHCREASITLYSLHNTFRLEGFFEIKNSNSNRLIQQIRSLVYDGGTDFTKINIRPADELLLFSDGVQSLSENWALQFPCPVYTISSSTRSNLNALRKIAENNGGSFINLKLSSIDQAVTQLTHQRLFYLGIKGNRNSLKSYPSVAVPVSSEFTLVGTFERDPGTVKLLFGYGRKVTIEKPIRLVTEEEGISSQWNLVRLVAEKRIEELETDAEKNREEILRLGREHSLVTSFTSLLVLERVEDYVRHKILPPAELLEEYNRLMLERRSEITQRRKEILENARNYSDTLWKWWQVLFPLKTKPLSHFTVSRQTDVASARIEDRFLAMRQPAIKMDSELKQEENNSGEDTLQIRRNLTGSVSGLQVSEVVVTGYSTSIRGWGAGSVGNGGQPLVLVDGVPSTGLPANDLVRDIQILSAKAAVALYGSKAINGAILVITKAAAQKTTLKNNDVAKEEAPNIKVDTKAVKTAYLSRLAKMPPEQQYREYLCQREKNILNPTFYYDMANFFFPLNKALGLQILTNLVELDFQNHELYKLLGFTLRERGESRLAEFVFKKILLWRPQEPQSYRDYALALMANKKFQLSLDMFCLTLTNNYPESVMDNYDGIEETIVTELNHLLDRFPGQLKSGSVVKKLRHTMPVDVRVVLNWNMNDTDIDLWLTDPYGEKCFYQNRQTMIGGRLSQDFTNGYGPEQFLLKKAVKGKYRIQVNYYGESRAKLAGKTTLLVEIYTHYGKKNEQQKLVTLQLDAEEKEGVYVGSFSF